MFPIKSFKIGGALQAVSAHAERAGRHRGKPVAKGTNLKHGRPVSVPVRGRMVRQVLEGRTPQQVRVKRAIYCGILFGIVGGAIALFITGTSLNSSLGDGYPTATGLLVGACCAVFGGVIGYFAGRR